MSKAIARLVLGLWICGTASADTVFYRDHTETWRFANDEFHVSSITDAETPRTARQYLKIDSHGEVLAVLNGVGIDTLAASPDESLFVGLSNSGIPGSAVVIFNRKGEVLLLVPHGELRFDYCEESVSVVRTWHGSKAGDVHFDEDGQLAGISLLDCRGERINLLQAISEAYARALERYSSWQARKKGQAQ